MNKAWVYILVIAGVTFLVRAIPFVLVRKPIKNPTLKAFLAYVPYATLAAMAFPDMLLATGSPWSGLAGFAAAMLLSWLNQGLFKVAAGACAAVLIVELIL
ncbi:MAG: AzlD domain-containing protein [Christensenellales bacterium]|jgi:branched-subunit amino acid transport protein